MNVIARPVDPKKLIRGATGDWEVVIGLEIHAQVTSRSKLFSGASTEFGGAPNSHVSLVDAAMPGMLPVINEECVKQAVRTGLGLKARINFKSVFDRKNYFYPDLPQGYQISQYKSPIVGEGEVTVDLPDGEAIKVGIERLHLEQDAGKSLHDQHPTMSFVDLNRSGVALMEIVSKPDLRSAEEAKAYVTKLRSILRYLGTCDGDMEKGNLRADVNVSVRRPGEPLGTRCEIKNVNSFRFIGQAIEHEARRQIEILEDGGALDAQQGGGARLSLLPRPGSVAARALAERRRRPGGTSARASGRQEGALHPRARALRLRRQRSGVRAGDCGVLRGRRARP
jgi:aspartyl-tRNA(Asn)/glutamyl-tRNA(Gln) amidotransferase subunit B